MSYILDALQRAETERERGAVPGLHTQQLTTAMTQRAPSRHRALWPWLAGFRILCLGGLSWGGWPSPKVDNRALVVFAAAPVAPAAPATPMTPAAVADAVPVATPKPVPLAVDAVNVPVPPKPQVRPALTAAQPSAVAPRAPELVPQTERAAVVVVPHLNELSDELRRQIPALTITGAVDSDYAAQRMLLVNGQVLRQGGMLTPDLSVEEIRSHGAVLNFRGSKFRITY